MADTDVAIVEWFPSTFVVISL